MTSIRVLRVYHAGRDAAHRRRERALVSAGVDVTLVVPRQWPDHGAEASLSPEGFRVIELDVLRPGDVNRHRYRDEAQLRAVLGEVRPELLDLHEEPFSVVTRQWLRWAGDLPVAMYTAQNVDKRFPPPFAQWESAALRRAGGMYPCSRQAASVVRGKGFGGVVTVLPLAVDPDTFTAGTQQFDDEVFRLGLVGRMVPEKGVRDAVRVLAAVHRRRPVRLTLIGQGPELAPARELADQLGVGTHLEVVPWCTADQLADHYRRTHVVLVPSTRTATWVEQFGRIILEGQACGAVVAGYASGSIAEVGGDAALLAAEGDVLGLTGLVELVAGSVDAFRTHRDAGLLAAGAATWDRVAAGQKDLYARVIEGDRSVVPVPEGAGPRRRRAAAVEEFGPTAGSAVGLRPFAVPVLRGSVAATRLIGAAIDLAGSLDSGFLRRKHRDGRETNSSVRPR